MGMDKKLTARQEKFCLEYAKSGNATQAYKAAGYKVSNDETAKVNGSRLLTYDNVQKRLADLAAKVESEKVMGIAEMRERLSGIARQALTESYFLMDGTEVARKAGFKDALKAMELLGKMQGAFLDRQQVELSGAVPIVIKDDL